MSLASVGEDRQVMISIGPGDKAPPDSRPQVVLAHRTPELLAVHDDAAMAQCRPSAISPIAMTSVVSSMATRADPHQSISFHDGDLQRPVIMDVGAFLVRGVCLRAPLGALDFERLLADQPFERCDARLIGRNQVNRRPRRKHKPRISEPKCGSGFATDRGVSPGCAVSRRRHSRGQPVA